MATSPKKSLALDTNLLLDLAGEEDFAQEFKEEFSNRSYGLLVPPTVVAELAFLASLKDAPQQELAHVALATRRPEGPGKLLFAALCRYVRRSRQESRGVA